MQNVKLAYSALMQGYNARLHFCWILLYVLRTKESRIRNVEMEPDSKREFH